MGYSRAGFEVVGVDIRPQPNYPFEFIQADALEFITNWRFPEWAECCFDAIHASPPCQHYANVTRWRGDQDNHPDLIAPTRALLEETGLPWVMENVRTRAIRGDVVLCGTAFGLPIRRHRHFETNWLGVPLVMGCHHRKTDLAFEHKQERRYADAMDCNWMSARNAREAIPPCYTELIGAQLMQHIESERAA